LEEEQKAEESQEKHGSMREERNLERLNLLRSRLKLGKSSSAIKV